LDDDVPALVTAAHDIRGGTFEVPKFARYTAGRDIVDATVVGQNLRDSDLTLVSAGRDIRYPPSQFRREVTIGGPGRLDLLAGRDVDLGFSNGVTTTGALLNATIPSERGADITIMAGLGQQPDYAGFVSDIIAEHRDYDQQVIEYVARLSGETL